MSHAICEAAGSDPANVSRLAARFSAPVFPDGTVTARIWELADGEYGFEAVDGEAARSSKTAGPSSAPSASAGRPVAERLSDLPLVPERIDDPAEAPAVLVADV